MRKDDELVGVVALDMDPARAGLLGDPRLSDHGPILVAEGAASTVARGILEWLNEDMAPSAAIWGLPESSSLPAELAKLSDEFGRDCTLDDEAVTPIASLPSHFDDYLAALSKKDRHELRRKIRQAEESGELAFHEATTVDDVVARFDQFLALMRESREDKAAFLEPPTDAFFRDIAIATAELGATRLGTLSLNGKAVAMTWCFETAEESMLYNSGYSPSHAALSLGIVSKALALESALKRGKLRFNFLRGNEDYKHQMGGRPRRVLRATLRQR